MSQFSHLHVHTQYSLLDGAASIGSLYKKAMNNNMPALAITDHGNMFGAFEFVAQAWKKTKIIGLRANQLSKGARPYVPVPDHISNVRKIARMELEQRRLPFIIRRPMPDGTHEYWRLADLLIL